MEFKNAWEKYQGESQKKVFDFAEKYKAFMSECKTERECVIGMKQEAEAAGFEDMCKVLSEGREINPGMKLYADNMGKAMILYVIGTKPFDQGLNIVGAHIDSPRIDLKPNPVYEDADLALMDTHYYGGVKKYQWVTMPLAFHGFIVKKDGSTISINIGEKEEDPVFCITDLLPHLAQDQMEKKAAKVIEGEDLDIIVGNMPIYEENEEGELEAKKDAVKANILKILQEQYNIEEEDFMSAEIEVVPAGKARDLGLDRSMILSYGHDDRVCAYTSFAATLQAGACEKTTVCLLVDKEEIGSVGATGMHSKFFEYTLSELMEAMGGFNQITFNRCMGNSKMLSSDVSAAFDPLYPSVSEKKNCAYVGKGIVIHKYTGSRGKAGSNDANPEFIAELRDLFERNEVSFHTAELGKVDQGGGGTIAYIMGNYNMNVVDAGIAVLSMHAPWEIISKVDLYEATKGYIAFLKEA